MTEIIVNCTGALASATVKGALTSGARGIPVKVVFNEEWTALTPILTVVCGDECREVVIDAAGKSVLPWECLIPGEKLRLGVRGVNWDGSVMIPTAWAVCGVVQASVNDAAPEESTPAPSPTVVEQINALALNAQQMAKTALDRLQQGEPIPDGGMSNAEAMPAYLEAEYQRLLRRLEGIDGPNRFSFGFATDLHFSAKGSGFHETELRGPIERMLKCAERLTKERKLSTFVLGGDYQITVSHSRNDGISTLYDVNRWFSGLDCAKIALPGNHEYEAVGEWPGLTEDEFACIMGRKYSTGDIRRAGKYLYLQVDDENEVIYAYICAILYRFHTADYNQLLQDFQTMTAGMEKSYPVIIFNHYSILGDSSLKDGPVEAYLASYDTMAVVKRAMDKFIDAEIPVLAWVGGHSHGDWCVKYRGVPVISCLQSSHSTPRYSQDGIIYTNVRDSAAESAFSIFTVDKETNHIWCTRFGLGEDRVIEWEDGEAGEEIKNLIFTSTDLDGNVFNGTGYKQGYALTKSNGAERSASGHTLTGFMPAERGSTVFLYHWTLYSWSAVALYDRNHQFIMAKAASDASKPDNWFTEDYASALEVDGDLTSFRINADVGYIRISGTDFKPEESGVYVMKK